MDKKVGANSIVSRGQILSELQRGRSNKVVLGVFSPLLGAGIFLCQVKEIWRDEDEEDVVVVLQLLSGAWDDTHVLYLHEIEQVFTFSETESTALPDDPVLDRTRKND
jgi:hypothetical protein